MSVAFCNPLAGVLHDDPAVFHDVAVVGEVERHLGVLLHQEHRHVLLGVQALDDLRDLVDEDGRQTERRFVEQHEPGPQHQRPADGQHLLLAAGQETGRQLALTGKDREVAVDQFQVGADLAVGAGIGAHAQVLVDGEERKHLPALRHMADAEPRHPVRVESGDVVASEVDAALLRIHRRADGLQHRGFAGPVGAEDGHDVRLAHCERDASDGHDGAVVGLDVAQGEKCHVSLPGTPAARRDDSGSPKDRRSRAPRRRPWRGRGWTRSPRGSCRAPPSPR